LFNLVIKNIVFDPDPHFKTFYLKDLPDPVYEKELGSYSKKIRGFLTDQNSQVDTS
jgi:hypothetical protein